MIHRMSCNPIVEHPLEVSIELSINIGVDPREMSEACSSPNSDIRLVEAQSDPAIPFQIVQPSLAELGCDLSQCERLGGSRNWERELTIVFVYHSIGDTLLHWTGAERDNVLGR